VSFGLGKWKRLMTCSIFCPYYQRMNQRMEMVCDESGAHVARVLKNAHYFVVVHNSRSVLEQI
jgi:hypothetical protein